MLILTEHEAARLGVGTGVREMADDWGLLDKDGDAPACCSKCENELDWVECENCGGEGGHDGFEIDPMWYDDGDIVPCAQCGGAGGWYWCDTCRRVD